MIKESVDIVSQTRCYVLGKDNRILLFCTIKNEINFAKHHSAPTYLINQNPLIILLTIFFVCTSFIINCE